MRELANQITQAAIQISNDLRQAGHSLKQELEAAQARVLEIQLKLDASNLAIDRLNSFQADIGGNLHCQQLLAAWSLAERRTPR
jgi:chromosome segregation ATPase